ncbi:UNVERIFIED_CONTAM: hypothetical protein K2H54_046015 [Gekko kuhli]
MKACTSSGACWGLRCQPRDQLRQGTNQDAQGQVATQAMARLKAHGGCSMDVGLASSSAADAAPLAADGDKMSTHPAGHSRNGGSVVPSGGEGRAVLLHSSMEKLIP